MGKQITISKAYDYDTRDLAVAFLRVATAKFGADALRGARSGWFGREPLNYLSVKVGHKEEANGISGLLEIRGFPGVFQVGKPTMAGTLPIVNVYAGADCQKSVEDFLSAVQRHLECASIYRRKAIKFSVMNDGQIFLEFIDASGISLDTVVYNEKVLREITANVWTLIEHPDACRAAGVPPGRKMLFEGPYGSGKTLAAYLTAQKATERGRTFVYLDPTTARASDAIGAVLAFARLYQPSVVFIEDVDREQREGSSFAFGRILAAIDGVVAKNADILVVMTTNHLDKITGGMQRPGRIDKIIRFGNFNAADVERLLRITVPARLLDPGINWGAVADACKDYQPAFVKEVGTCAVLTAISEAGGGKAVVTEARLIESAKDLEFQHRACKASSGFTA